MANIDRRKPTETVQSGDDQSLDKGAMRQAPNLDKDELDDTKLDDVSGGIAGADTPWEP